MMFQIRVRVAIGLLIFTLAAGFLINDRSRSASASSNPTSVGAATLSFKQKTDWQNTDGLSGKTFRAGRLSQPFNFGLASPNLFQTGCPTPSFAQAPTSPESVGLDPHYVCVGHFNADSNLDIVTTNSDENTLSVLLGDGTGNFTETPGPRIPTGIDPITVEDGDFNNDGKSDLAITNQGAASLTILLGNGDGTFAQASGSPISVGTFPRAVAVGNFNGDANQDLIVSNGGADNIGVLLGNGNGTFTNAPNSPFATGDAPFHAVIGNFNGDAHSDFAVALLGDSAIRIYLGNGNGTFTQSGSAIPAGTFTSFLALGDFNEDNFQDVAAVSRLSSNMFVFLGNGTGAFSQAAGSPYGTGVAPMVVATDDVNFDAHLDLVVANESNANTFVFLGNGSGGFGSPTTLNKGQLPTHLAVADFNGDNRPDIATSDAGDAAVTILLNTCTACFPITVNPATIASGTAGSNYSQIFSATSTGGTGPYSFNLTGTLPTGLTFSVDTLSGTPTQTGSFPIIVTAIDNNTSCTGNRNYTLVINCQSISVDPASIPNGIVGASYSQTFTQSGGIGSTTFSLSGALPNGMNFSGSTLSGTPTQSGSFPITITATDSNNCTGSRGYTLVINACPTITVNPATIPAGTAGAAYSQTFTQSGGAGSASFNLTGTLPTGMSFSGDTLSGTPTQTGSFPITVTATDSNFCTGSRNYTLVINCQTYSVTPATIPAGTAGTAYSQTFTHSGGIGAVTFVQNGNLPAGITFSGATLSGTPTQTGSYPISITATDANGCTATRNYNLVINCQAITVNPATIPSGTVNAAYSQTFTQTGGIGTTSFSINGTLPTGLNFTGATLSGTPTQSGSFPITVTATDSNGCTGSRNYTLVINCQTIAVNPAAIPSGTVNAAYSQTFAQTGGVGTVNFSLTGTLPTGLSFSGATLSGTPTQSGNFPITVTATDQNNCTGSRSYTLVINCQVISILPATIPAGTTSTAYSQTFTANGAIGAVTFVQNGKLPAGMTFSGATLSGTPTQTGSFPISITATDANNCSTTRNYTLVINCQTITITPTTIPAGTAGTAYNQTFTQSGGIGAVNFTQGGKLPAGMSFSGAALSGTPTQTGNFPITVTATDANGCSVTRNYTLVINCQTITVNPATISAATVGTAYSQSFTQSGGIGAVNFSLTGALPSGLSFAGTTLSGTPTQTGTFPITVTATDANGCTGSRNYTLVVNCQGFTVNPATIPAGTRGVAYNQTFTQTGGTGAATFMLTGTLPNGMSFVGATLSGTPTQPGSFPITVTATDSNSCVSSRNYTLVINCQTITVNPATIPAGTAGALYSQSFTQSGGVGTTGFSLTGTLPTGMTFSGGALSGTPTQTGSFPITVTATDSNGCTGSRNYTLVINCQTITVNPATIPAGTAGTAYSQSFTQSGGIGATGFSLTGALPTGMTFSGGSLSGTPTQTGSFPITVTATDSNGCTGSRNYTLVINCQPITVNPATLPNGFVGIGYGTQTLSAVGAIGSVTFDVSAGALPNGVTISGAALSGTPTATGTFNFTLRATDGNGCTGTRAYTVIISGGNGGLQFYPLAAPVRLVDTRVGASGCFTPGAKIPGGTSRTQAAANTCGIPATAQAVIGNITTVQSGGGYLTIYPSNATQPNAANSNYNANEVLNNVFTVGLGTDGAFKIFVTTNTDVVVDITGYYAPPATGGLYFHPLPKPIRLLETRASQPGCFTRNAPLPGNADTTQQGTTTCDGVTIPAAAKALVGNATTVFPAAGGYLTLFPADASRPNTASGNYDLNEVLNSPFTVGLSATGQFKIFTTATTELVIDVLGYYSPDAVDVNGTGLLFNPITPTRLLETRAGFSGCTTPGAPLAAGVETAQPAQNFCTIAATAKAIVGNATVVQPGSGGFLTFWPSDATRPLVATSNYLTGDVLNRHFTVGLGANGQFKIFAYTTTHLVVDVSGYFAP